MQQQKTTNKTFKKYKDTPHLSHIQELPVACNVVRCEARLGGDLVPQFHQFSVQLCLQLLSYFPHLDQFQNMILNITYACLFSSQEKIMNVCQNLIIT